MKPTWDECNVWVKAKILAYGQIRDIEDQEQVDGMFGMA